MAITSQTTKEQAKRPRKSWWRERSLLWAVVAWVACLAAIYPLSHGVLPSIGLI